MKDVINVLSIDGGGIRGVLPARILVYIEDKLSELYGKKIKLSEHFDIIAGTSTGGILTSIYCIPDENGNSKYTAQDALDLYMNNGSKIFKKELRYFYTWAGIWGPRYRVKHKENLFDYYMGNKRLSESVTNMILTAVDTQNRDVFFFKSYKAKENEAHNIMIKDATRASSAAPTYFEPKHMYVDGKEVVLIDGGLGINNPSISAYIEAEKLFPNAKKINVLSIGTAPLEKSYAYKMAKKWGIITGAPKLFNVTLTSMSDVVDYQLNKLYEKNDIGSYLRVQPQLFGASGDMDAASKKNLNKLQEAGRKSVELYKYDIDDFLERTVKK